MVNAKDVSRRYNYNPLLRCRVNALELRTSHDMIKLSIATLLHVTAYSSETIGSGLPCVSILLQLEVAAQNVARR